MMGSFRRGEAGDPEIYSAAVAKVLSVYEPDVVDYVTDPVTGLASRNEFLPTIKEIRAACDARAEELRQAALRKRDYLKQIAQPLRIEDQRPPDDPNLISWKDLPPDYRPIGRFERAERVAALRSDDRTAGSPTAEVA
jgi:hypothetical protein